MTFAAAMLRVVDADKNAENIDKAAMNDTEINGNAITAGALFRSFPSLAKCMLCIMKEETSRLSSVNTLHQSLYPLLLLLSRLQAAMCSTDDSGSDTILNLFIDPVIKCLGHTHHKVRIMAARALSILCQGDGESDRMSSTNALMVRCLNILSFRPCLTPQPARSINHNLDHGGLLALKVLLISSSNPTRHFEGHLLQSVIYHATCFATSPPPCIAVALEIWLHISKSSVETVDPRHDSLEDVAYRLVYYIEARQNHGYEGDLVGLAGLAAVASAIVCDLSKLIIFNPTTTIPKRAKYLKRIGHLFESTSYDIQLHAVKSFKKGLHERLDELLNETSVGVEEKKNVLQHLCEMALGSLIKIMMAQSIEAHPPTIRRISRCALELVYAYKSIFVSNTMSISKLSGCGSKFFWNILLQMRIIGGGTALDTENAQNVNILAGNTLELMALYLAEQLSSGSNNEMMNNVAFFVKCIENSTDPLSFWRVRYGAAVAVRECNFLSWKCLSIEENVQLHNYRLRLQLQMLKLLQDNDDDVRYMAGRAMMSPNDHPSISLMTMESFHSIICQQILDFKLLHLLVDQLVHKFQGIENQITITKEEFSFSENAPPPSSILNVSMTRKIFEEEDANPFKEDLVLMHLVVYLMTKCDRDIDDTTQSLLLTVLRRCKSILSDIKKHSISAVNNPDVTHDITWEGQILPKAHGLILGSIFAVYVGQDNDCIGIVEDALSISQIKGLRIHPCIAEVIKALSSAVPASEDTKKKIMRCCFLLPNFAKPNEKE